RQADALLGGDDSALILDESAFAKKGQASAGVARQWKGRLGQACLRPRERFWDIPVPKIDSAFDNLFVPQPSWSPSTTQQLRKLVAAPYLAPNDWTPRSEAYFVFPLAQGTPGKQCGLAATGVYQPSLRSPWLAAKVDNAQVGVFSALCRGRRVTLLDSRLYLPKSWVEDEARCQ
ncbi:transposase, partial [Thiolapillus sp.]|uniref:transposase n=1 Tax=Thiolapillus sp. TaxID=2017437 RepID=UPI003AF8B8DC